jgi:hypothetical protein
MAARPAAVALDATAMRTQPVREPAGSMGDSLAATLSLEVLTGAG